MNNNFIKTNNTKQRHSSNRDHTGNTDSKYSRKEQHKTMQQDRRSARSNKQFVKNNYNESVN